MRKAKNVKNFKSLVTDFFNLKQKLLLVIHDPGGITLLTRLRLKFSHLNDHKFYHNCKHTLSPMRGCRSETKTADHYFLALPISYNR